MSLIGTTPGGSALEIIRARRRLALEIICIAGGLALVINLLASCLLNAVAPDCTHPRFWWLATGVCGLLLVVSVLGVIFWLLRQKITEVWPLVMVVPLYVDRGQERNPFIFLPGYHLAENLRALFARTRTTMQQPFTEMWPGPNPLKNPDFRPGQFCWQAIEQLLQAVFLVCTNRYGKRSLTAAARYLAESPYVAGRIPSCKLVSSQWPPSLKNNKFLKAWPLEHLQLPDSARLYVSERVSGVHRKPGPLDLHLITDYASLTYSISPYWSRINPAGVPISPHLPAGLGPLCFLRIPGELRLTLKSFCYSPHGLAFAREQQRLHYLWFQELAAQVLDRFDWGRYRRGLGSSSRDS